MNTEIGELLELQSGVIARHQVLVNGMAEHDIRRLLRRREWSTVHPGVYVNHTGPLTFLQRAWAAVLLAWPAALCHQTAIPRRTTAARLLAALASRSRITRRAFLQSVLRDVADGTCSVLEHGYLDRVERPHGLPAGQRQVRESKRGPLYRDVDYRAFGFIAELDGRLFHTSVQERDRDLERDLDAAIDGRATVRLGWGQVYPRACATAEKLGILLAQRGWDGTPTKCPDCPDRDGGESQPPGGWRSPLSA